MRVKQCVANDWHTVGFALYMTDLQISVRTENYVSYFSTKHMLWIHKRDGSFEHPKHMCILMDKKIIAIFSLLFLA